MIISIINKYSNHNLSQTQCKIYVHVLKYTHHFTIGHTCAQQEIWLPHWTFTGQVRRPIDDTIEELGGAPSIVNVYYHNFTNYFITYFDSTI